MAGIGSIQYAQTKYAQPVTGIFARYKFFQEILNLQETLLLRTRKTFQELLTISDLIGYLKVAYAVFVETVSVVELSFTTLVKKAFSEIVELSDSIIHFITGYLFIETINLVEVYISKTAKAFRDALTYAECFVKKLDGFYVMWKKRLYESALSYTRRDRPATTVYSKRDNTTASWDKKERPTETTYTKKTYATSTWSKKDRPHRCETE